MNANMNETIKARWIQALTSGEYEQGKGKLLTNDGKYCCLGVLTDLYCKETKQEMSNYVMHFGGNDTLSREVQEWAGLDNKDIHSHNQYVAGKHLSDWNDTVGKTFAEIAEMIALLTPNGKCQSI